MKNRSRLILQPLATAFARECNVERSAQLDKTPGQMMEAGSTSHGLDRPATPKPRSWQQSTTRIENPGFEIKTIKGLACLNDLRGVGSSVSKGDIGHAVEIIGVSNCSKKVKVWGEADSMSS
jgi:hypothetical protein